MRRDPTTRFPLPGVSRGEGQGEGPARRAVLPDGKVSERRWSREKDSIKDEPLRGEKGRDFCGMFAKHA